MRYHRRKKHYLRVSAIPSIHDLDQKHFQLINLLIYNFTNISNNNGLYTATEQSRSKEDSKKDTLYLGLETCHLIKSNQAQRVSFHVFNLL